MGNATCVRTINLSQRYTDGRTDNISVTIPRDAPSAERGKNVGPYIYWAAFNAAVTDWRWTALHDSTLLLMMISSVVHVWRHAHLVQMHINCTMHRTISGKWRVRLRGRNCCSQAFLLGAHTHCRRWRLIVITQNDASSSSSSASFDSPLQLFTITLTLRS